MNTGKLERNSVPQSPNAKGPARSPFSALASYQNSGPPKQYTHDYQSLGLQQGDWNYLRLFTSGVSIYGVGRDGRLDWIRLDANGSVAVGPITLDTGWGDYEHVFGGGDGVIYAVNRQGQLLWFKHDDAQIGPAALKGPVVVGGGWAGLFPKVFSAGDGEIFAVRNDGQLFRWKHTGHKDGTPQWEVDANGSQYRQIGEGWDHFTHVFASQKNNIYAIDSAGSLYWYRLGFAGVGDSLSLSRIGSAKWEGPIKIGGGLENSTHVFATMPSSGPAGGVR